MIISHKKRFIFIKSKKTGSTSLELALLESLTGKKQSEASRAMEVSQDLIVGYRGSHHYFRKWPSHMKPTDIRDAIGPEIFNYYKKICVVRDPISVKISEFNHLMLLEASTASHRKFMKVVGSFAGVSDPIWTTKEEDIYRRFEKWIDAGGGVEQKDFYYIRDALAVDILIHYEALIEGASELFRILNLSKRVELGRYKDLGSKSVLLLKDIPANVKEKIFSDNKWYYEDILPRFISAGSDEGSFRVCKSKIAPLLFL